MQSRTARRNAAAQAIESVLRVGEFTHDEAHGLLTELARRFAPDSGAVLRSTSVPPLIPEAPPEPTRSLASSSPARVPPLPPSARGMR